MTWCFVLELTLNKEHELAHLQVIDPSMKVDADRLMKIIHIPPVIHDDYFFGVEEGYIRDNTWETPWLTFLAQPVSGDMKLINGA